MHKFKAFLIVITVLLLLSACDHFFSDIERDLEYWSSTVLITGNEIPAAGTDNEGYLCLPSECDKTVILKLTNPQKYILKIPGAQGSPSDIVVFENGVKGADGMNAPRAEIDYYFRQTSSDRIELIYKEDFLKYSEWGSQNLSPAITLYNKEGRKFEQKYTFKLRANTPPLALEYKALCKTQDSSKWYYVLCFKVSDMDKTVSTELLHKDIASITVTPQGGTAQTLPLTVKPDKSGFNIGNSGILLPVASVKKLEAGDVNQGVTIDDTPTEKWIIYLKTDVQVKVGAAKEYTLKLTDEKGLSSPEITKSTATNKLSPVELYHNNSPITENSENSPYEINTNMAITLQARAKEGASITGTIEKKVLGSNSWTSAGTVSGTTPADFTLPALGNNENEAIYKITLKASAAGYVESESKTFFVKLVKQFTVTFRVQGGNGSLQGSYNGNTETASGSNSPSFTVSHGGSVTFAATPAEGYAVDSWSSNVGDISTDKTTATLSNVSGDTTVTVKFKKKKTVNSSDYNAWTLLKKVVEIADPNSTITIDGKIEASSGNSGQIKIDKTLTIRGKTVDGNILDANGLSRIFKVENGATLFLENLTLKGGKADEAEDADKCGGAIYASNAIVNITDCTITGNKADTNGGGIYVEGGTTNITNCIFTGNTAKNGGGIYMTDRSYPVVIISGGTIGGTGPNEANKATGTDGKGGGIYVGYLCDLRLQDSTGPGGQNVLITSNKAAKGGGVYANYADVSMKEGTRIAVDEVNNDVYLDNTSRIKVFNTLTAEAPVARITPEYYREFPPVQVLEGNITGGTPQNYKRFTVTPEGSEQWEVDSEGNLKKKN
ncbi:hypothetical protein E4O04_07770 [Treponema sp. OMZ 799]|uniref:InlB B-repeat-containing protein n=1 Tax=Treponema sp. OMZ 799 TaxID=2563668 RepID=UPI0020A2B2E1|nr:hypothetical protein [Treponema sp. OMZ 799]UTC77903.1 hypothetical protein E4O04_07770 [Treponema sp. OMZ 799]